MADRWVVAAGGNSNVTGTWATSEANALAGVGGASVPTSADDIKLSSVSGQLTLINGAVFKSLDCHPVGSAGSYTNTLSTAASATASWGDASGIGEFKLVSGMTFTAGASSVLTLVSGSGGTANLTTAGHAMPSITQNTNTTTTFSLQDDLTANGSRTLTITQGVFVTNDQDITYGGFNSSNTNVRTLTLGSSDITLSATGTAWNVSTATNLTMGANTAIITLTGASASFLHASTAGSAGYLHDVRLIGSGSSTFTVAATVTVNNLTRTGTAVKTDSLSFGAATTLLTIGTLNLNGNSATNRLFVESGTDGTPKSIRVTTLSASNVDFQDIAIRSSSIDPIVLYPEDFGMGTSQYWETDTGGRTVVTRNFGTDPIGGTGADRVVAPVASSHYLGQAIPVAPSTQYTFSFYAKNNDGAAAAYSVYDVTNSTNLVAPTSYFSTISGGGWHRISVTFTTGVSTATARVYPLRDAPGAADILLWGGQLDVGPTALTYAPAGIDVSAITGLSGDGGGNSGLIFTPPLTLYFRNVSNSWDQADRWSTSSGGAGDGRTPLPQDSVNIDANSWASTTISSGSRLGDLNFTGFTGTWNLAAVNLFGSLTLSSTMTLAGTSNVNLLGRGTHTVTMNGRTMTGSIAVIAATGTYTLQDDYTTNRAATAMTLTSGTWNTAGHDVTFTSTTSGLFVGNGGTLASGGSTFTFNVTAANTPWSMGPATSVTVTGKPNIVLAGAATATRTITGGANQSYGILSCTAVDSPGTVAISGAACAFDEIVLAPGRKLTIPANVTVNVGDWNNSGEDRDYIYLSGVTGTSISTPDHSSLDLTAAVEMVVKVRLDDLSPSAPSTELFLLGKYLAAGNQRSFLFTYYDAGGGVGRLRFYKSGDGTAITASVSSAHGLSDATVYWFKVTHVAATGVTAFYWAPDTGDNIEPASWTAIGGGTTGAGVAMFSSSADFAVGSINPGSSVPVGRIYRGILRDGIDGTIVADFDASLHATGQNTYTDSTGKVWTLNGLAQTGDGRIEVASATPGTPAFLAKSSVEAQGKDVFYSGEARTAESGAALGYLTVPGGVGDLVFVMDHPDLDITGDLDLRADVELPDWSTAVATNALLVKDDFVTSGISSYGLGVNSSGNVSVSTTSAANSISGTSQVPSPAFVDGSRWWVRAQYRQSDRRVQVHRSTDGTTFSQVGSNATVASTSLNNTTARLKIGNASAYYTGRLTGKVYRAIVRASIDDTDTRFDQDFSSPPSIGADYLRIQDIKATGHGVWFAGSHSVDVSGNSYWSFTDLITTIASVKSGGAFVLSSGDYIKAGGTFTTGTHKVKVGGMWVG